MIHKNKKKENIIYINDSDTLEFSGLYDYDDKSQTLIVYREENNIKKVAIYKNNNKEIKYLNLKIFLNININGYFNSESKLNKIKLVPCSYGYENQAILLFIDKEIYMVIIKRNSAIGKTINLENVFKFDNFDNFQFIVHSDFLLILKYNEENNLWKGKIFSLDIEEDELLFEEIENNFIELNGIDKKAKFTLAEIKEKKYLISTNIINEIHNSYPLIKYCEIFCNLSRISTDYKISGEEGNSSNKKIPLGNCLINYFYHCFEKFPLIGAIQYNFKNFEEKKKIYLGFFFEGENTNLFSDLKDYINELKSILQMKKKINFEEIDFNIIEEYKKNYDIKDCSLGHLLIRFLEVVPIQIAKIMGNEFKVMSDGENIDKILKKETQKRKDLKKVTKFNIKDYSEMIHFSNKESIFNYFELPVIVICCF